MFQDDAWARVANWESHWRKTSQVHSQRHVFLPPWSRHLSQRLWKTLAVLPLHRQRSLRWSFASRAHYSLHLHPVPAASIRPSPSHLNHWWWKIHLQGRTRAGINRKNGHQQHQGHHCLRLWPWKNIHFQWCRVHQVSISQHFESPKIYYLEPDEGYFWF